MKQIANASTDVTTYFVMRDSTNHAPKADVTITDIDLYYQEQGAAQAAKVDATALAAANSAHSDNTAFHCGNSVYRVDWPDAAFDGGVGREVILIVVCTGCDTIYQRVLLSPPVDAVAVSGDSAAADNLELACDNYSATRGLAGTALPAAAADAAGGLPISDAGALDIDTRLGYLQAAITSTILGRIDAAISTRSTYDGSDTSGVTTLLSRIVGTLAAGTHNPQTGDAYARIGANGASLSAVPWNAAWDAEAQSECADAITAAGLSTLDAAAIRTAIGLATANLDTQLGDLPTNAELTAALAAADDAVLAAIAALNNLSSAGAQAACAAALTAFGASTYAGGDTAGTTTLLSRLTALRAGYLDYLDAAISSRLAAAGYTAPPSAADNADAVWGEALAGHAGAGSAGAALSAATAPTAAAVADAVWDEATSGHAGAGTTGAALTSASSAGDPWSTALPGSYTAGQAGYIMSAMQTDEAAIKAKTDLISTGAITVTSPVASDGTTVTTYQGDDYDDAHGREIAFTVATPDLTGATVVLHVGDLDVTCTLADAGLSTQHFYAELTAVESATLTGSSYTYSVVATFSDSDVQTLVTGTWVSNRRAS